MSENLKPVIKISDGTMSVAIFEQPIQTEYGERKMYRSGLRKSFKDKTTNEWKSIDVTLFEDEMLTAAELIQIAHAKLLEYKMANRPPRTEQQPTIDSIPDEIAF